MIDNYTRLKDRVYLELGQHGEKMTFLVVPLEPSRKFGVLVVGVCVEMATQKGLPDHVCVVA